MEECIMLIKIEKKEYQCRFGIKFNTTLDNVYSQSMQNGVTFGTGIEMAVSYLQNENVTAVQNVLMASLSHLKTKPSNEDLEDYIEEKVVELGENGVKKLCDEIVGEMTESPLISAKVKTITKA